MNRAHDAQGPGEFAAVWRARFRDRELPVPLLRPALVGSAEGCDIQLRHRSVAARHARLERRSGGLEVLALGESGRVWVDGRPVKRALLRGGETVRFGELEVTLERGPIRQGVAPLSRPPPSFEEALREALWREVRRLPWFMLSLAIHALLFLWVSERVWREERPALVARLAASVATLEDAMPRLERAEDRPVPPEPDVPEPEVPDLDPLPDEPAVDLHDLTGVPIALVEIGTAGGGAREVTGFGRRGVDLRGVGGELRSTIGELRRRGLDLAILVDTTASMDAFLSAAKRAIDRIIDDLADLVPTCRLGMVAYRDRHDEYVTRVAPLTTDRYAIHNFLETLHAGGGGDVPEALFDALEVALERMEWRPEAHRVLLVVADAPPHPEDMPRIRMLLEGLRRSVRRRTHVSVLMTGAGRLAPERQSAAEEALRRIAQWGGGEFGFLERERDVTRQIVAMTLGRRHLSELERLLGQRRDSVRRRLVRERVEARDVSWLVRKLHVLPVDPLVVEGLVEIGSPAVALRCLDVVCDRRAQRASREAALYVLRRLTGFDEPVNLVQGSPLDRSVLDRLKRAVHRTFVASPRGRRRR